MFEKEIKILNVSVEDAEKKIRALGAEFVFKTKQKIYTYDLPTISHRLTEALDVLLERPNPLVDYSYRQKLKTVFLEAQDLLSDVIVLPVLAQYNVKSLPQIVDVVEEIEQLAVLPLITEIKNITINPNKWVRLRDTDGNVTLTVKHVFEKNTGAVQKVVEYEIKVDSVDETDRLLTALGFAKRNVQEKIRIQYKYKNAEIDIDQWPKLAPYIEIESPDTELYAEIIEACGFDDKEIVSCNTEELYRRCGINSRAVPELLFE